MSWVVLSINLRLCPILKFSQVVFNLPEAGTCVLLFLKATISTEMSDRSVQFCGLLPHFCS